MRFDGTVVIVTGAAGAIGSAAVARLTSSGATVLAVDRDAAGLERLGVEAQAFAGTETTFADFVPLGRHGTADEVARFVTFLLSDDAAYATGTAHSVDGAMVAA